MARTYVQFMCAMWRKRRENDFIRLSANAQRTYMVLSSQPDISAAGVLRLAVDHWADLAQDTTPDDIRSGIAELQNGAFLVVDHDTQELLVRSFVRWDKGYNNSKRRPVILDAAADVDSVLLRVALAVEFERVGLPTGVLNLDADQAVECVPPGSDGCEADPMQESLFSQVDRPSDGPSQDHPSKSLFDRVVVTTNVSTPQPANHNPQPVPAARADAAPTVNQRAQNITRTYTDVVKLSRFTAVMGVVKKAIGTGDYTDDQIREALGRLAEDRRTVTAESLRIELDGRARRRAVPDQRPSTTDQRVAAVRALKAEYIRKKHEQESYAALGSPPALTAGDAA